MLGLIGRDPVLDVDHGQSPTRIRRIRVHAGRPFVEAGYDSAPGVPGTVAPVRDLLVLSIDTARADDPEIARRWRAGAACVELTGPGASRART